MAEEGDYLPLVVVAEQTGVSLRSLREWCATGRLVCERFNGAWTLRAVDVEKVRQLCARQPLPRRRVTFILPVERATAEIERAVLQLLPTRDRSSVARLSIDDMDYVAFTADADAEAVARARELIENLGGQLLDP